MDGMLSQDEINALLNGMTEVSDSAETQSVPPSPEPGGAGSALTVTDDEKDAIGEVANISMGTSATTLYSLVNRKVSITTPVVEMATWDRIVEDYERPCVFIKIQYISGLQGTNILILKESDVNVITDLMMGGDGTNIEGELGELHLSAISEAMNQMMGSSATSLSSMLGKTIDISPPESILLDSDMMQTGTDISPFLGEEFVKITFRMQVGDLVDSKIMQLYPIEFAKTLYGYFIDNQEPEPAAPLVSPEMTPPTPPPVPTPMDMGANMGMDPVNMGASMGMGAPMGMNMGVNTGMNMSMPAMGMPNMPNINIQPASFQAFSNDVGAMQTQENISLIKDVPLEVTVELGRTSKAISDILDFAPGTIIELEKIAGEPVDVLVNGKLVAKGEVVVIEENFGVRVTEILK